MLLFISQEKRDIILAICSRNHKSIPDKEICVAWLSKLVSTTDSILRRSKYISVKFSQRFSRGSYIHAHTVDIVTTDKR